MKPKFLDGLISLVRSQIPEMPAGEDRAAAETFLLSTLRHVSALKRSGGTDNPFAELKL